MRTRMTSALAIALLVMPILGHSAPMAYTITFDATNTVAGATGDSDAGSFLYDADTDPGTMTGLAWDFGSGRTGGMTDATLADHLHRGPGRRRHCRGGERLQEARVVDRRGAPG